MLDGKLDSHSYQGAPQAPLRSVGRPRYWGTLIVTILTLLLGCSALQAQIQPPTKPECSAQCQCIKEGSGEWVEVQGNKFDPNQAAKAVVLEVFDKSWEEILEIELGKLPGPRKSLYYFLKNGPKIWKHKDTQFEDRLRAMFPTYGLKMINVWNEPPLSYTFPKTPWARVAYENGVATIWQYITVVKVGSKFFYFQEGYANACLVIPPGFEPKAPCYDPSSWKSRTDDEVPPTIRASKLIAITAASLLRQPKDDSWTDAAKRQFNQFYVAATNEDIDLALQVFDAGVAITPFLGTADLLVFKDTIKEIEDGSGLAIADLCGSAASDFFIFGKAVKAIRGVAKIVQVATFALGTGSVAATGYYLYHRDNYDLSDGARAALMGIELLALVTDRSSHKIIMEYGNRKIFLKKTPDALPLASGHAGPSSNKNIAQNVKPKTDPIPSLVNNLRKPVVRAPVHQPVPEKVLDGLTIKSIDDLIADPNLPETLTRTDVYAYLHLKQKPLKKNGVPVMDNGKPVMVNTTYLDELAMHPAVANGLDVTPIMHIGQPKTYSGKSGWLSFSDGNKVPKGFSQWGDHVITFRIKDFLRDVRAGKFPGVDRMNILTSKQLSDHLFDDKLMVKLKETLASAGHHTPNDAATKALRDELDRLGAHARTLGDDTDILQLDAAKACDAFLGAHQKGLRVPAAFKTDIELSNKAYMFQLKNYEFLFHGAVTLNSRYVTTKITGVPKWLEFFTDGFRPF